MSKKISELTAISGGVFANADLFEISVDTGSSIYVSRKITGAEMIASIGSGNIGNSDLTIDTSGTRKLIMGGALSSDVFTIRNSADTKNLLEVRGNGDVFSYGRSGVATNLAYGLNALNSVTSSAGNTVFGHYAGASQISGNSYSTFVGWYAGNKVTTGVHNVAVGFNSLLAETTGGRNVAVGYSSMQISSGGANNTAIGYESGGNVTTGDGNTFLGYKSGDGITTGGFNIHVGYQGSGGTGITTGSNNVLIGSNFSGLSTSLASNIILADGTGTQGFRKDANDNVILGQESALSTTATDGFVHIPTCAGTPTGTPTTITGSLPMVIDSTNNKMYIYSGGSWVALN